MAATNISIPSGVLLASCISERPSKIRKCVQPSLLLNFCLPTRIQSMWKFCTQPLRDVSYTSLVLSYISPTCLQSNILGGLFFQFRTPRLGSLIWGLDLSFLAENLFVPLLLWGINLYYTVSPPLLLTFSFLPYILFWEIFSPHWKVVLVDNCSVNSCNFDVPVGGIYLRSSYSTILATPLSTHLGHDHFNLNIIRLIPLPHLSEY